MSGSCAADCSANVSSIVHSIVSHVSIVISVSFFILELLPPSLLIYIYT